MKILTVNRNDAGQRLDKFLHKTVPSLPQSLMYKSIRTKKIKVNRKRAEIGQMLNEGDTIQLFLPEDLFDTSNDDTLAKRLSHISQRFSIIYEDENILLCDKPAGLAVHSDDHNDGDTLIDEIQAYLYQKGEYDPRKEQSFAPALCNRIDRNTAGIVIAAKNAAALREMNRVIKDRKLSKKYLCAVHGEMEKESDTITAYMKKDPETNTVTVYDHPIKDGRIMITGYRVIREKDHMSLLEVTLFTGRTHQIRAHMAHIGHPLLGDGKYGVNRDDRKNGFKYQQLYSYHLEFNGCDTLAYLNGRSFSVPLERIWFVKEFE